MIRDYRSLRGPSTVTVRSKLQHRLVMMMHQLCTSTSCTCLCVHALATRWLYSRHVFTAEVHRNNGKSHLSINLEL